MTCQRIRDSGGELASVLAAIVRAELQGRLSDPLLVDALAWTIAGSIKEFLIKEIK